MLVMVYDVEWGKYRKEHIPDPPERGVLEFSLKELMFQVERFDHASHLSSMASRTAFHPGGGRQRW